MTDKEIWENALKTMRLTLEAMYEEIQRVAKHEQLNKMVTYRATANMVTDMELAYIITEGKLDDKSRELLQDTVRAAERVMSEKSVRTNSYGGAA